MDEPGQNKPVEAGEVTPQAIAEGLAIRGFGFAQQLDAIAQFLKDPDQSLKAKSDLILKLWKMQGADDEQPDAARTLKSLERAIERATKSQAEAAGVRYPQ